MRVFHRYLLLQVPGWALAAVILYALNRWVHLPLWIAALLMLADIVKDLVLYPYLRKAYETDEKTGVERLLGHEAVVHQRLDREGYVRIRGELWKARSIASGDPPEPGMTVRVVGSEGLILQVAAEPEADADP